MTRTNKTPMQITAQQWLRAVKKAQDDGMGKKSIEIAHQVLQLGQKQSAVAASQEVSRQRVSQVVARMNRLLLLNTQTPRSTFYSRTVTLPIDLWTKVEAIEKLARSRRR